MRINNKRIIPLIESAYALLLVALFSACTLLVIPVGAIVNLVSPSLLIIIILLLLYFLYKLGPQHLEYDSDGEVIHIIGKDVFWSKYFPAKKTMTEFPKKKLVSFRVRHFLFKKTLELFVTSKRAPNGITKLKFNITYLNHSEISDLKRSLYKIVKKNNEQITHTEEVAHND